MEALSVKSIVKRFPNVLANDNVSLSINKGEIFAIVGENGAGKSTLMKIVYGLYTPNSGEIYVFGKKEDIKTSHDAIRLKIGMVHQEFMLIPRFTVTENIVLGDEPRKGIVFDYKRAVQEVKELSEKFGLKISPTEKVENLSVGIQQRVEILKILRRGAEILILDEPTAVLTPQETEDLFKTLRSLKQNGKTIIFISHKLGEVMEIADRVAVMRRGRVQGVVDKKDTNERELAKMMVGRDVVLEIPEVKVEKGDVVFQVSSLSVKNVRGITALKNVSFDVRSGEIVGIAGVEGNGQAELVNAVLGFLKPVNGKIYMGKEEMRVVTPYNMRTRGMSYITEDRKRRGLVLPFKARENIIMGQHTLYPFSNKGVLNDGAIDEFVTKKLEEFDVRPPNGYIKAESFSGGNQQKLILAREMSMKHNFLLASQPTRGLDVGATEFVYKMLIEEKKKGIGILLISLELSEIMGLSDRILVLYGGEIVGEVTPQETTEEELGLMMLGLKRKERAVQ
ncbi:MAG: ABC transporter ATP-binding protein [Caldisericaceae bacterium]